MEDARARDVCTCYSGRPQAADGAKGLGSGVGAEGGMKGRQQNDALLPSIHQPHPLIFESVLPCAFPPRMWPELQKCPWKEGQ